jgi:hypothetical protein
LGQPACRAELGTARRTGTVRVLLGGYSFVSEGPWVYAADVSVWPHLDRRAAAYSRLLLPSFSLFGRPTRRSWLSLPGHRPGLGFARDRWVAPMDAWRLRPTESSILLTGLAAFVASNCYASVYLRVHRLLDYPLDDLAGEAEWAFSRPFARPPRPAYDGLWLSLLDS